MYGIYLQYIYMWSYNIAVLRNEYMSKQHMTNELFVLATFLTEA